MKKDTFDLLTTTPANVECAQLGSEDYHNRSKQEAERYIKALRKVYGPEPKNTKLRVKSNPHDFGSYLTVVCDFDSDDEVSTNYAYSLEDGMEEWPDDGSEKQKITPERIADAIKRRQTTLDNPGFCKACGAEHDNCEPDARNYKCDHCGKNEVFGAEEFL